MRRCRQALTEYIKGRQGYDYNEHGQFGQQRARRRSSPTRSSTGSASSDPVAAQMARSSTHSKALGVDQFAVYLQHDGKDHTLAAVRRARSSPRLAEQEQAKK